MTDRFISRLLKQRKAFRFCCVLLVVKLCAFLLFFHFASRYSLVAQILDVLGISSKVYIGDVSCNRCNAFDAVYLLEPKVDLTVAQQSICLLVLVISHINNIEQRQAIRNTWATVKKYEKCRIETYFFIGLDRALGEGREYRLKQEMLIHHDTVQIDLEEDYQYLTNKTMGALNWATTRYPQARFLLKSDDDSFNVIQRFVKHLAKVDPTKFVGGMCSSGEQPHRDPNNKWYIPETVYASGVYPIHAKGRAYVLSQDSARKILSVSTNVRFNSMEDLYVTGLCRTIAGLSCTHIPQIPNRNEAISDCDVALDVFNVHHVRSVDMLKLWKIYRNETARKLCRVAKRYSE